MDVDIIDVLSSCIAMNEGELEANIIFSFSCYYARLLLSYNRKEFICVGLWPSLLID